MADATIAVRFQEAIDFLRLRTGVTQEEWDALLREAGFAAGRLAEDQSDAMVADLLAAVADTMEEGGALADFRERYDRIVAEHGWSFDGDPGWHSELVFRVNAGIAQAVGRWQQIQRLERQRPFIRYVTADDHRVRPTHAAWHGVVLPVDHPFWRTHYPPNGFNCRCTVQSLNERDIDRYGFERTDPGHPALDIPPDPGWFGNVGVAGLALALERGTRE